MDSDQNGSTLVRRTLVIQNAPADSLLCLRTNSETATTGYPEPRSQLFCCVVIGAAWRLRLIGVALCGSGRGRGIGCVATTRGGRCAVSSCQTRVKPA